MDYGLIGGIGNALSSGVDSYTKALHDRVQRDSINKLREIEQQRNNISLTEHGYESDPTNPGGFRQSEAGRKALQFKQDKESLDAEGRALSHLNPEMIAAVPEMQQMVMDHIKRTRDFGKPQGLLAPPTGMLPNTGTPPPQGLLTPEEPHNETEQGLLGGEPSEPPKAAPPVGLLPGAEESRGLDAGPAEVAHPSGFGLPEGFRTNRQKQFDAIQDQREFQRQQKEDAVDRAITDKKDKALTSTTQLLESARGNPMVQQAQKDFYSAGKAERLIGLAPNGDPNKMSPQMVSLLRQELGKMATGGVPTAHELEALNSNALPEKLSRTIQIFNNQPTSANAGAFIKEYSGYIQALKEDARETITERYNRIIEPRKKLLGDEHYQNLKDQYLGDFEPSKKSSGKGKTKGEGALAPLAPEDLEAVQWARQNPNSPFSQKILEKNGVK